MIIKNKDELYKCLAADASKYPSLNTNWKTSLKHLLFSNPINDQRYIWKYIKTLRYVEYYETNKKKSLKYYLLDIYYLFKLRKYARITGFQIPPFTCGAGLQIWHWGPIIINPKAHLGNNCTLYAGVLIGHKSENKGAPIIGNNVFIGAGTKIIGNIRIGDNVTIGQNCLIVKNVEANHTIVETPSVKYL